MQAVCCLTGTKGVGKTEIALEYAHRNRESFSEVFWVTNPTTMLLDVIGNTKDDTFSIDDNETNEPANKKWLAILDNVEGGLEIKFLLYKWDLSRGSILITTQQREFATPAGVLWYRMEISYIPFLPFAKDEMHLDGRGKKQLKSETDSYSKEYNRRASKRIKMEPDSAYGGNAIGSTQELTDSQLISAINLSNPTLLISNLVNSYIQDQSGLPFEESIDSENILTQIEPTLLGKRAQGRKRTKTGCLTCRRRRIKCGEERPTCQNCIKSHRLCKGYNQRVVFKNLLTSPIHSYYSAPGTETYNSVEEISRIAPKPGYPVASTTETLANTSHGFAHSSHPENAMETTMNDSNTQEVRNLSPPIQIPSNFVVEKDPSPPENDAPWELSDEDDPYDVSDDKASESGNQHLKSNHVGVLVALQADYHLDEKSNAGSYFSPTFLLNYIPSPNSSPLRDNRTARIFGHFVNVVGPSISMYERHPANPSLIFQGEPVPSSQQHIWSYTFSTLALSNQALLHAILAVSALQIATIQDGSITASLKHYAYALRRVAKRLGDANRRRQPATLVVCLLLGWYELASADFVKWSNHLLGSKMLLSGIDFEGRTKYINLKNLEAKKQEAKTANVRQYHGFDEGSRGRFQDDTDSTIIDLVLGKKTDHSPPDELPEELGPNKEYSRHEIEKYEIERDLFWWFCKQDALRSILSGTELFLKFELWARCPPRAPLGRLSATYGTFDHLILLLGRVADFSNRDQRRKLEIVRENGEIFPGQLNEPTLPPGFTDHFIKTGNTEEHVQEEESSIPPSMTEIEVDSLKSDAEKEWGEIRLVFHDVKTLFGDDFQVLGPEFLSPITTPFGDALLYRTYGIAGIWTTFYMGLILHTRVHPSMPPYPLVAAGISFRQTSTYGRKIGRIVAGVAPDLSRAAEVSPGVAAALIETSVALFVAGIMYQTPAERDWTIQRFTDITRVTGWKPALSFARGCESAWIKAHQQGRGPRYVRSSGMKSFPKRGSDGTDTSRDEHGTDKNDEEPIISGFTENFSYALGILGVEEDSKS